jgi:hypothetical protein
MGASLYTYSFPISRISCSTPDDSLVGGTIIDALESQNRPARGKVKRGRIQVRQRRRESGHDSSLVRTITTRPIKRYKKAEIVRKIRCFSSKSSLSCDVSIMQPGATVLRLKSRLRILTYLLLEKCAPWLMFERSSFRTRPFACSTHITSAH